MLYLAFDLVKKHYLPPEMVPCIHHVDTLTNMEIIGLVHKTSHPDTEKESVFFSPYTFVYSLQSDILVSTTSAIEFNIPVISSSSLMIWNTLSAIQMRINS